MIQIPTSPDMGQMLKSYITQHRKYKSGIANWMGTSSSNLQALISKPDMKVSTLWKLSHVLQHSFFADIATQLPTEYQAHITNPLQARVKELEQQNMELTLQVKTLEKALELVGKK